MEKHHNMTGEIIDKECSLTTRQFVVCPEKQTEKKEPYKIGIGALFLWLLFVVLIVTILWQNNQNHKLKDTIVKNEAKIEFLK